MADRCRSDGETRLRMDDSFQHQARASQGAILVGRPALMPCIFLSASIPPPPRHPEYPETADVLAILDSISALVSAVMPSGQIVFGGHPAIIPLIHLLVGRMTQQMRQHVIL